ncbi:D-inositol-3-phosphate glycosyltransferase [compost metagenome]
MKRAAIALVPSTWAEPFGLTALEAHAAGAALVSSGRGGLREASGPHALYLNRVTPAALVAAAERLITHPEERLSLARAAQAYVELVHAPGPRAAQLDTARMAIVERARQRCLRRAGALERSASGVQAWPVPNES